MSHSDEREDTDGGTADPQGYGDTPYYHQGPLSLSLVTMTHQYDSSRIGAVGALHQGPLE